MGRPGFRRDALCLGVQMSLRLVLPLFVAVSFALSGCVAAMATNALATAISSAQGEPQGNAHLQPAARDACSAHASQYGAVHIIDVEQRSADRIIVWGTVEKDGQRRSFECGFGTKLTSFKLREIKVRR